MTYKNRHQKVIDKQQWQLCCPKTIRIKAILGEAYKIDFSCILPYSEIEAEFMTIFPKEMTTEVNKCLSVAIVELRIPYIPLSLTQGNRKFAYPLRRTEKSLKEISETLDF